MKLSNRVNNMQYSPIRKLTPYAVNARAKGKRVLGLNIGQPDIETPDLFFKAIRNFDEKVLKYSDSRGENVLLDSFINYYKDMGIEFTHENLIVTNGASEGLYFTLFTLCDAGDEVIIPEPFYTNYSSFVDMAGCVVKPFATFSETGFHLPSKEKIMAAFTEKTKAILICNPSNPTGTVYTKEEIQMLAEICREKDLYFITDEVYREFVYDDFEFYSPLSIKEIEDKVILIDSISKRYSSCGARIGLVASKNVEIISAILKLTQARLCSPTLEQIAAAELYNTPKAYFTQVKEEYTKRRNVLYEGLNRIPGISLKKPEGAFYIICKLPIKNAEDFCKWILEEFSYKDTTVMMAPAEGFYATEGLGKNEVRISYCIKVEDLELAVEIIGLALAEYSKTH